MLSTYHVGTGWIWLCTPASRQCASSSTAWGTTSTSSKWQFTATSRGLRYLHGRICCLLVRVGLLVHRQQSICLVCFVSHTFQGTIRIRCQLATVQGMGGKPATTVQPVLCSARGGPARADRWGSSTAATASCIVVVLVEGGLVFVVIISFLVACFIFKCTSFLCVHVPRLGCQARAYLLREMDRMVCFARQRPEARTRHR